MFHAVKFYTAGFGSFYWRGPVPAEAPAAGKHLPLSNCLSSLPFQHGVHPTHPTQARQRRLRSQVHQKGWSRPSTPALQYCEPSAQLPVGFWPQLCDTTQGPWKFSGKTIITRHLFRSYRSRSQKRAWIMHCRLSALILLPIFPYIIITINEVISADN